MEKIICDICGFEYPETDSECPLCGCVKKDNVHTNGNAEAGDGIVKGGRFSKSNVRKRLNGAAVPVQKKVVHEIPEEFDDEEEQPQSNWGLIAIVILLLLAIIAVSSYIAVSFLDKDDAGKNDPLSSSSSTAPIQRVPCTDIDFTVQRVALNSKGSTFQLVYSLFPVETTDKPSFTSKHPSVATVDKESGLIQAVSQGSTVITVTCGDVVQQIPVECQFGASSDPTTKPSSNPTTTPTTKPTTPTNPASTYKMQVNNADPYYGTVFKAEATVKVGGKVSLDIVDENGVKQAVTWTMSKDGICTVTNGRVFEGVASGNVTLTTTYGGQDFQFTLRVS